MQIHRVFSLYTYRIRSLETLLIRSLCAVLFQFICKLACSLLANYLSRDGRSSRGIKSCSSKKRENLFTHPTNRLLCSMAKVCSFGKTPIWFSLSYANTRCWKGKNETKQWEEGGKEPGILAIRFHSPMGWIYFCSLDCKHQSSMTLNSFTPWPNLCSFPDVNQPKPFTSTNWFFGRTPEHIFKSLEFFRYFLINLQTTTVIPHSWYSKKIIPWKVYHSLI